MAIDYLRRILTSRVYEAAVETPLEGAPRLSSLLGHNLLLKREDLQPVRSFKIRGAYNRMALLPPATLRQGVICASAGNHAQGVAFAAQRLGCRALIVMPVTTPRIKVAAVEARGAQIELYGDSYDDAYTRSLTLAREHALAYVHPYDHVDVIAGQGTIGMEILRQHGGPIHAIFAAVGGGGLLSGIAAYVKSVRPEIRLIGVEPRDSAAMTVSLKQGKRVKLPSVGLFADGVAVRQVGRETFRVCREWVDDMIVVDNDDICAAIKDVFEETRSILEPAGALAVAGAKAWAERSRERSKTLVAVACGANMNFDRLRFVAERAEIGERREALLAVTIPERPGSFREFCRLVGARNITEFNYRYADPTHARVFVGLSVQHREEAGALLKSLQQAGLEALDLTDNELAKSHVRHLVGGRAPGLRAEVLCRFEFPERPGALMQFLTGMDPQWNITLFHYRNHGADFGRVLVGFDVPLGQRAALRRFLRDTRYRNWDETDNPAYALFLG